MQVGFFDIRQELNEELWELKYGNEDDWPEFYYKWPVVNYGVSRGNYPWIS